MNNTTTKCSVCKRRKATWRIRNAFSSAANGLKVCDSDVCFGTATGGYPAEGARLDG